MQTRTPVQMVTITEDNADQRVDNFLMAQFRNIPKGRIYRMIRSGEVRVNRSRVRNNTRLNVGDIVRLPPVTIPTETIIHFNPLDLALIKESIIADYDEFMMINKPSGFAVHKGSGNPYGIIEILRELFPDQSFLELVQRLDRDTSGLLLIAKSRKAHLALQETDLKRYYTLLVVGKWPENITTVTLPLDTNHRKNGERHVIVSEQGKVAETHFKIIQSLTNATLLEADLVTGRTHQIRVHAQSQKHPIVGDPRYGNQASLALAKQKRLKRIALHASRLKFMLENHTYNFEASLPKELKELIESL